MPKRVEVGVVTSDKMNKTRVVEIAWQVRHPRYKKYVHRKTKCYVHDDQEQSNFGDTVEIRESRPRSKMKRWELVRVIEKSRLVDVQALRAARKQADGDFQDVAESIQGDSSSASESSTAGGTAETSAAPGDESEGEN